MARRKITMDEKIERQKQIVFRAKEKYEEALAELDELNKKRDEIRQKELLDEITASKRSYEEIVEFLRGADHEEDESR